MYERCGTALHGDDDTRSLSKELVEVLQVGTIGTATFFIKIHQMAHVSQKVGQACAMAMVLMALILLFTVLQRLFFRYVMKDSENTFNAKANKAKALW